MGTLLLLTSAEPSWTWGLQLLWISGMGGANVSRELSSSVEGFCMFARAPPGGASEVLVQVQPMSPAEQGRAPRQRQTQPPAGPGLVAKGLPQCVASVAASMCSTWSVEAPLTAGGTRPLGSGFLLQYDVKGRSGIQYVFYFIFYYSLQKHSNFIGFQAFCMGSLWLRRRNLRH